MSALALPRGASIDDRPAAAIPESQSDLLYQEFIPLVKRLTRQYGDSHEMREELQGEIYCRFRALVGEYDPDRGVPLKPYIVRMLTSSVYTYARQRWIRRKRELSLESLPINSQPGLSVDPYQVVAKCLATEQILTSLPDAIHQLSARQRQVVIWRYYEGRTFEWIADALSIMPTTARSLLRHALNNLRSRLGADLWDGLG